MIWRDNIRKKLVFSFSLVIIACLSVVLMSEFVNRFAENVVNESVSDEIDYRVEEIIEDKVRKVWGANSGEDELIGQYSEISPDGEKQVILYKKPFVGDGQLDYRNYLSNQHVFAIKYFENGAEYHVFNGDDGVGYPHWIGNDFIFFTTRCGTGCRGLRLVDIRSQESYSGTITTTPISKDGFKTGFQGWFDKDFEFVGFDENIRSVYLDGKAYLIFEMWNDNKYLGEKKFLFTGSSLEEL